MSVRDARKPTTHQLSEAQRDEDDQKKRERLDRKELKRLNAFTDQMTQDSSAAIISIPASEWEQAQSQDVVENAEKLATELALTNNKRPNLTIKFPEVNAENIGGFLFLIEAATAFAGGLLNIEAFNQPGVEEGKIATYALMGRQGYEQKHKEIKSLLKKKSIFSV